MSSTKVNTSAPVGHSTPMVKLGATGQTSGAASSVTGVSDSSNVGTSTDQYLPAADASAAPPSSVGSSVLEENSVLPVAVLKLSGDLYTPDDDQNGFDGYLSPREAGRQIENYEKTVEVSETPLRKTTQAFG